MKAEDYLESSIEKVALGELAEAEKLLKKAVELQNDHFEIWHTLAMVLMKLQKYPDAIEAGKRAVALNPQDQLARVSLSMYFQKNGQIPEAEAEAAKAKVLSWGGKLLPNQPGEKLSE